MKYCKIWLFLFIAQLSLAQSIGHSIIDSKHCYYSLGSDNELYPYFVEINSQAYSVCYIDLGVDFISDPPNNTYDYLWITPEGWLTSRFPLIKVDNALSTPIRGYSVPIYNGPPPPNMHVGMERVSGAVIPGMNCSSLSLNSWPVNNSLTKSLEVNPALNFSVKPFASRIASNDSILVFIVTVDKAIVGEGMRLSYIEPDLPEISEVSLIDSIKILDIFFPEFQLRDQELSFNTTDRRGDYNFKILDRGIEDGDHLTFFLECWLDRDFLENFEQDTLPSLVNFNLDRSNGPAISWTMEMYGPRDPNGIKLWTKECDQPNEEFEVQGKIYFTNEGNVSAKYVEVKLTGPRNLNLKEGLIGFEHRPNVPGLEFRECEVYKDSIKWIFKKTSAYTGFPKCGEERCLSGSVRFYFKLKPELHAPLVVRTDGKWSAEIIFDNLSPISTGSTGISKRNCLKSSPPFIPKVPWWKFWKWKIFQVWKK